VMCPHQTAGQLTCSPPALAVRAWAKEQGIDIKERGRVTGRIRGEIPRGHRAVRAAHQPDAESYGATLLCRSAITLQAPRRADRRLCPYRRPRRWIVPRLQKVQFRLTVSVRWALIAGAEDAILSRRQCAL